MKYWKEATEEEYEIAPSKCIDNRTNKKFIVISSAEIKDIMTDFLGEVK